MAEIYGPEPFRLAESGPFEAHFHYRSSCLPWIIFLWEVDYIWDSVRFPGGVLRELQLLDP